MRRKFLCGLAATMWAAPLAAQSVPARNLWEFPLGAVLQPAALSTDPASGFWNPAVHGLGPDERIRAGVTSLSASSDQGVDGQLLGLVARRGPSSTIALSVARSAVNGIVRTDSDPQDLGDVPYSSLVVSLAVTRQLLPHVTLGVAARWREGRIDQEVRHATAADFGLLVEKLPVRQARVAIASFLWRPGREIFDRPSIVAASDAVLFSDGTGEYRAGYSLHAVNRGAREHGPYLLARVGRLEANIAVLQTASEGRQLRRARSGLALRYNRYLVGIGREEGVTGLGPLYQFTLSSLLR